MGVHPRHAAGGAEWLLRGRRVRAGQGSPHSARPLRRAPRPARQDRASHAAPHRRLSLGQPARDHARQPGPGLDRQRGLRLDGGAVGAVAAGSLTRAEGVDEPDPRLPADHRPPHRDRRAGAQVAGDSQVRARFAVDRLPAPRLLPAHLPDHLAAQQGVDRPAAPLGPAAGGRERAHAQRGGAAAAPLLQPHRAADPAQARAARQRLRALAPPRPPGDGAAVGRGLPLHPAPAGGEPAPGARQRPHPVPALRGRPRQGDRHWSTSRTSSAPSARSRRSRRSAATSASCPRR